jgi:heat shock protein HslJ
MRPRLALLAALSALPAIAAAPAPYHAHGTEPFWDVTIAGGRIVYRSAEGVRIAARAPARRPIRNGYAYATPRFRIEVTHARCNDGMGERDYVDTFRLFFAHGTAPLEGCGGAVLPPQTLDDTSWDIVRIDNVAVSGENYRLDFGEQGRLSGQAGCNRFSGAYSERGRTVRASPIVATRMACPGARMTHEQRVLRLLGGPVAMRYPDGNTLLLIGHGVTVRLRRP